MPVAGSAGEREQPPEALRREKAGPASVAGETRVSATVRLPLVSTVLNVADDGGALSLRCDFYDNGLQAAGLAARVMKGEDPGKIPFQSLSKKLLHVYKGAARRQGLPVTPAPLTTADRVIE